MTAPVKLRTLGFRAAERGILSLRLPAGWPECELPVSWWWRGADGTLQHGQVGNLSELAVSARAGRIHVWTPAAETMLTQVTLPTRSRAKIAQALPYALEDQLLGEPESLHFAYRPRPDGSLAVGVTGRERLQSWMNALEAANLEPAVLCPATLALPWDGHSWSLVLEGDEAIVRSGPWSGFTCSLPPDRAVPETLVLALREARTTEHAPQSLLIYNPPPGVDLAQWSAVLGLPVDGREGKFWAQGPGSPIFSLLQSEFAPLDQLRQVMRVLRPATVMILIWFVIGFAINLGDWWRLTDVEHAQRQEMLALFMRSFPDARTVVDPALQMERNLAALQSGGGQSGPGDLLSLLVLAAPVIQSNPAAHLQSLQYADASVTFDLSVPDYQAIEALHNALAARGLATEVVNANSHNGTVDGRIRIKPGSSP
ncbi:MAG: type II secretion system protein GspL [Acidiferrobacterales bacterium]